MGTDGGFCIFIIPSESTIQRGNASGSGKLEVCQVKVISFTCPVRVTSTTQV